ncbi:YdcF family protein [uncultured Formosa sp.]|uniref:YdcF family protein n=1 Tax=uncultured Formosa sp. TaxID=255435 RepID=UPI0026376BB0|nr:YdcF family protein [uncultured Formosa sp.]
MKKYVIIICLLLTVIGYSQVAQNTNPNVYQKLAKKNYYLLDAIDRNLAVKKLFEDDTVLKDISKVKHKAIVSSLLSNSKTINTKDLVDPYIFSDSEILKISERLEALYDKSEVLREFVKTELKPSGAYNLYEGKGDQKLLSQAWALCARGVNHVLKVYGQGESPQYAEIDSISYNVNSSYYKQTLFVWSDHLAANNLQAFYSQSTQFVLSLLYFNHRDEAVRYEPLGALENKNVKAHISSIDFDQYKYASVLVLGNGPENYRDRLSALGKFNIKLGAEAFLSGDVPLIIVSGGHAHPYRAAYAEAIEMKKELITQYNIPENRIIIEPYARHTTTNLRNASRLLIAYNVPIDRLSLVVTNNFHSEYTGSEMFVNRCFTELGYQPATIKKRLNKTTLEYLPQKESLQQNPLEPLDP